MGVDQELEAVKRALLSITNVESRISQVLRSTFDQLLNGQLTGRYRWDQLYKTEKTHMGSVVEINLQREFNFADGIELDYRITGIEVDCKYSQKLNAWMIPHEAIGHLCLVVWANDDESAWSVGLVRANTENLSPGSNQDKKRTLNAAGREAVVWLFPNSKLPPNIFLQLPETHVASILDSKLSGQKRVNKLMMHAKNRIVGRAAIATAAQQDDFMKRMRANGGARQRLAPLGYVIFGHEHRLLAQELALPVPAKGEFVSTQLVPVLSTSERAKIELDGKYWAVADVAKGESVTLPAPRLPRAKKEK